MLSTPRVNSSPMDYPIGVPMSRQRNAELAAAIARDGRHKYVLAAVCGVPQATLSSIVNGRQRPSPAQAARLADVLGISIETVTGGAS